MSYRRPVNFTKTGQYGNGPEEEDDVYTVEEFRKNCYSNLFIDYDGFGYPVKDGKADPDTIISPSRVNEIPKDATHVIWFNR